jgi:antitoxin HicB
VSGRENNNMTTVRDYLSQPYARILIPDETGGFHAEILEFPGCFAQGETPEEAYRELEDAAESWVESCLARGQEVPEPSSSVTYSGRIAFRLPKSMHKQAARLAERDQTSLNTYLVSAVAERNGACNLYNALAQSLEQRIARAAYHGYMAAYGRVEDTAQKREVFRKPLRMLETASTTGQSTGR